MKKLDDMTDVQRDKRQFVKRHLKGIMKALDPDITRMEYNVTEDNDEYVIIYRRNDIRRRVNVSADTLFAMTSDVLGSLCI